jgi:ribosomal protein S18 acetylase RimI-like enzyme
MVAVRGDEVVGSVMAGYDGHRGWISRIAVRKAWRAHSVGSELLAEAECRLMALGCIKINLQVVASNASVVDFYKSCGYAVEERISMSKQLSQSRS